MVELPLEKLADFVAALRNEVWNCPEQERRALPRIRVWAPRTIRLAGGGDGGTPVDVWLTDLACGGVSFLSPRSLDVGAEFTVTMPSMDASPATLTCAVLHCQLAPNGSYLVGSRFVKEQAATEPAAHAAA